MLGPSGQRTTGNRRFSALIGPAGTGKTTLLSALVRQDEIATGGVLLLAPTGKARVRMEEKVGDKRFPAKTIAQFLYHSGRFDGESQRYLLTGEPGEKHAETVIIDECSMMTEEMLAATFEALTGVKRLILVGDHRQLPPIGAGKPFVDIVRHLEPEVFTTPFPRHHAETGYTELTISMRQSEAVGGRDDVRLAGWFTGMALEPGEDEILGLLNGRRKSPHLEIREWNTVQELLGHLEAALHQELGENGKLTQERFDSLLGATLDNGYAASCFNPFLFSSAVHSQTGCGASALGLLTGIPPANFAVKNQDQHYPDEFMLRCLRRHGFRVLRLTQCNLSQNTAGVHARHVLLLSQLFRENEATWIVLFNGVCYHNFDVYSLEGLSFLNKPLLSAYVVFHPRWQMIASPPAKPLRMPTATRGGVSWASIRKSGLASRLM